MFKREAESQPHPRWSVFQSHLTRRADDSPLKLCSPVVCQPRAAEQSCCCRFRRVRLWVTHRRQPARLPRPWDSPGKNTGVACHCLLQCMKVKSESEVAQSSPTLRPHGLQPTRLLRPRDFPGKSTEAGCQRFLRSRAKHPHSKPSIRVWSIPLLQTGKGIRSFIAKAEGDSLPCLTWEPVGKLRVA